MSPKTTELYTTIIFISLLFLIIVIGLVVLVALYYRRKKAYTQEKLELNQKFEEELLKTQIEVQEQTMQTIASDLHDNIGQLLSLTTLTLGSIDLTDQNKTAQKIESSLTLVNKSIKELRELAKLLHGEQIVQMGLANAIELEINWLKKVGIYEIKTNHEILHAEMESSSKDLIILRLFQEIVNNIIKHAEATEIEFRTALTDGIFYLMVKENGKGFDVEEVKKMNNGMGLNSIKKRITLIDGTMEIISAIKEGTTITIEIPYP